MNRVKRNASDPDFGILLGLAYAAFVDELRDHLAAEGYPDLHRWFGYVARSLADGPLNLRALADRLAMTPQGALKIVDELGAGGYVERIPDPDDGRGRRVRLSKRGAAALAAARAFHQRFERELGRDIGADRAVELRALLAELVARSERRGVPLTLRPL